jgi:hypothetical protein
MNAGISWSQLTDVQPSLAIGALAIDSTGQVILAGTGEDNNCSDCQQGLGILKSINGGGSWSLVGQVTFGGHHIGALAIDRGNSSHLFAAADIGLYVSTDGGSNWTLNTSYTAMLRGFVGGPPVSGAVFQIIQDPATATKYWLVAGDLCVTEAGDILTGDGASSWTNVTPPILANSGFGSSRIAIGVGSDNSAYTAAANCLDSSNNSGFNLLDAEKTTTGGLSWTEFTSTSGLTNYFNLSGRPQGQGQYDNVVAVDPKNSANAVFGGVDLVATSNGGNTFSSIGSVYSGGVVHPDFHAIAFTGLNSFYVGNDGGVWKTNDLGGTWSNLNSNLSTVQFYQGTALDATRFLGGTQDNGSPGNLPGAAALPGGQEYHGGDGFFTAIDPTPNSTTVYAEYGYLMIEKGSSTLTGAASSPYDSFLPAGPCVSTTTDPACIDPKDFVAPFVMDPSNPKRLLAGTNRVYQTTNGGTPAGQSSWTAISRDLTTGTQFAAQGDALRVMAMGPSGLTNIVMTGSRYGKVFFSTNATGTGATWSDITGNLPVFPGLGSPNYVFGNSWISGVAFNPGNAAEAWVSIGGLSVGHVWHTTNANAGLSATWTDISGSLSNAITDGVLLDPRRNSTIYVATDFAVMVCTTCGGSSPVPNWTMFGSSLPTVKVSAISFTGDAARLIAWTHGRGAWQVPPLGPGNNITMVTATPSTVPADAASTAAVTTTVTSGGTAVASDVVAFGLSGSPAAACGTLGATTATTNASGQATVTYTASTTGGLCTVTGNEANGGTSASTTITQTVPATTWIAGVDGVDAAVWVLRSGSANFMPKGGVVADAPAIVAVPQTTGPARLLYIVTGPDHNLWVRDDTNSWQPLTTSPVACLDNPAGVISGGTLYVACEGSDHALWHAEASAPTGTNLPTVNAMAWQTMGGVLTAGPAVASVGGTITYAVLGTDQHIYMRTLAAGYTAQDGWFCSGHPALASIGIESYFACRGTDGALWESHNLSGGWTSPQSLGGILVDGPGIAASYSPTGPASVIFFAEGSDRALYHRGYTGGWTRDGGVIQHGAAATGI